VKELPFHCQQLEFSKIRTIAAPAINQFCFELVIALQSRWLFYPRQWRADGAMTLLDKGKYRPSREIKVVSHTDKRTR
jgi:hypothetical protein